MYKNVWKKYLQKYICLIYYLYIFYIITFQSYQFGRLVDIIATGIYECGEKCLCKQGDERPCQNSIVERGIRQELQLFKTFKKVGCFINLRLIYYKGVGYPYNVRHSIWFIYLHLYRRDQERGWCWKFWTYDWWRIFCQFEFYWVRWIYQSRSEKKYAWFRKRRYIYTGMLLIFNKYLFFAEIILLFIYSFTKDSEEDEDEGSPPKQTEFSRFKSVSFLMIGILSIFILPSYLGYGRGRQRRIKKKRKKMMKKMNLRIRTKNGQRHGNIFKRMKKIRNRNRVICYCKLYSCKNVIIIDNARLL